MKPRKDLVTSSKEIKMHNKRNYVYFFSAMCFLYALPFILHSNLYLDDVYRSVYGDGSWSPLGRPLADVITFGLSLNNNYLSDFYPLGIILAILIFTFIIYFIINRELSVISSYALISLPSLLVSPIFLQNMSYHYDSTAMVIALALAVLSFYTSFVKGLHYSLASVIFLVASLSLYQPCANIFLGLMAANITIKIKNSHNNKFNQLILDGALFCCSFVIYYVFVVRLFQLGGQRATFIEPSELFNSLLFAFKGVYNIGSLVLTGLVKAAFLLLLAIAAISSIIQAYKYRPTLSGLVRIFISVSISCILLLFSAIGTSFLVAEGITDLRVMVGMSSVVFYLLVVSLRGIDDKSSYALTLIPLLVITSISFQYVNASSNQRQFEISILGNVARDVNYGANSRVYISGVMPLSPQAKVAISAVPFIGRVLPASPPWVSRRLAASIGIGSVENSWGGDNQELISTVCVRNLSPFIDNSLYSIYNIDDLRLVFFKGSEEICSKK